jgi:SAM-dependent methyltransferase
MKRTLHSIPQWCSGKNPFVRIKVLIQRRLYPPYPEKRRLNLGGGVWYHPRWENVDLNIDQFYVDYKMDLGLKKPIELPNDCTVLIFSSHLLEHIKDDAALFVLKEAYRLLQIGGYIRISVPDLEKAFQAYRENNIRFFKKGGVICVGKSIERKFVNFFASYRSYDCYSGGPIVPDDLVRQKVNKLDKYDFIKWCADQIPKNAVYKAHINGYDYEKLHELLKKAGFKNIKRSEFRGSYVLELRHKNFDNRPLVSLFVEAQK